MSLLSGSLPEREEVLKNFFMTQAGIGRGTAEILAQNLNAKFLTPLIDEGQWSLMYNDSELLEMIEQGMFPLVDQLRQDSYNQGFKDAGTSNGSTESDVWDASPQEGFDSY